MTFEEMEKSLIGLRDIQVVQGQILNRLELAVERNTEAIAGSTVAIARNAEAIARNTEAIGKLSDGFVVLQAAMKDLVETIERFIKGLDSNGRRRRS